MIEFCKSGNCPYSEELLAMQRGELFDAEAADIRLHISLCDFCNAELNFYSHYPNLPEEQVALGKIPTPLFELAEALLNTNKNDLSALNRLVKAKTIPDTFLL